MSWVDARAKAILWESSPELWLRTWISWGILHRKRGRTSQRPSGSSSGPQSFDSKRSRSIWSTVIDTPIPLAKHRNVFSSLMKRLTLFPVMLLVLASRSYGRNCNRKPGMRMPMWVM